MTTVLSSQFSWHKDTQSFVAEASDLPRRFSPKEGFVLASSKYPGQELRFVLKSTNRDRDNDVTDWRFVATDPRVNFTVTVFND